MFQAMVRFNQAIARFMEYAFYNPETFILITADHETGDLYPNAQGQLEYHSEDHTSKNVLVFAWGDGSQYFDGQTVENIQIAHTIASFMGDDNFGDQRNFKRLNIDK
jgi:alkaline phosphatase